jgi:hypothetical protein
MMSDPYFVTWVHCLWDIFWPQQYIYTLITLIPILTTVIQGFYLKYEGRAESHPSKPTAFLQLIAGIFLLIYEGFQFMNSGIKYLRSYENVVDLLAITGYIASSVYYLFGQDETTLIAVLLASLLVGYLKLWNNIKILTKVSYLLYTIWYILLGILPFCFVSSLIILLASMMFYVPQYFQEDGAWPHHGYWTYLFYAYDYSFGNWGDFGDKKNFEYILLFH